MALAGFLVTYFSSESPGHFTSYYTLLERNFQGGHTVGIMGNSLVGMELFKKQV